MAVMLQRATTMSQAPSLPWNNEAEKEEYARNPRAFLLERCKSWMENAEFFHNYIVTATYYLPAFVDLAGGQRIHFPEKTQDEALWQGKVGLVVGKGKLAFCDSDTVKFHGQDVKIGDWLQYDIHDPRQFTINRIHCRLLKDVHVIARLTDPRLVY